MYSDFYEILLPALRFEKVEETHREVNDTEENDARPRQKYKQKEKRHEKTTYDAHRSKETQNQPQANDMQGTHTLPEQRNADRKRSSISAFKKWQPERRRNQRRQPDQK